MRYCVDRMISKGSVAHNKSSVNKSKTAYEKKQTGFLHCFEFVFMTKTTLKFLKEMSVWSFYISSNFLLLWEAWKLASPESLYLPISIFLAISLTGNFQSSQWNKSWGDVGDINTFLIVVTARVILVAF